MTLFVIKSGQAKHRCAAGVHKRPFRRRLYHKKSRARHAASMPGYNMAAMKIGKVGSDIGAGSLSMHKRKLS